MSIATKQLKNDDTIQQQKDNGKINKLINHQQLKQKNNKQLNFNNFSCIEIQNSLQSSLQDQSQSQKSISSSLQTQLQSILADLSIQFNLIKKIGQGGFGFVYKAIDVQTDNIIAIKFEIPSSCNYSNEVLNQKLVPKLYVESQILRQLAKSEGFPKCFQFQQFELFSIMVMQHLDFTLEKIFRNNKQKFSAKTVAIIGLQMTRRLQELHNIGYIYRDVKPDNIMVSQDDLSLLYLIDFGLAKSFRDENGQHIPQIQKHGFVGTACFCSINSQLGYEISRRDDIESLAYLLIYLMKGNLPWLFIEQKDKIVRNKLYLEMKINLPVQQLCSNLPVQISQLLIYAKKLKYQQEPNYHYINNLLKQIIIDQSYHELDWCGAKSNIFQPKKLSQQIQKKIQMYQQKQQQANRSFFFISDNNNSDNNNNNSDKFLQDQVQSVNDANDEQNQKGPSSKLPSIQSKRSVRSNYMNNYKLMKIENDFQFQHDLQLQRQTKNQLQLQKNSDNNQIQISNFAIDNSIYSQLYQEENLEYFSEEGAQIDKLQKYSKKFIERINLKINTQQKQVQTGANKQNKINKQRSGDICSSDCEDETGLQKFYSPPPRQNQILDFNIQK